MMAEVSVLNEDQLLAAFLRVSNPGSMKHTRWPAAVVVGWTKSIHLWESFRRYCSYLRTIALVTYRICVHAKSIPPKGRQRGKMWSIQVIIWIRMKHLPPNKCVVLEYPCHRFLPILVPEDASAVLFCRLYRRLLIIQNRCGLVHPRWVSQQQTQKQVWIRLWVLAWRFLHEVDQRAPSSNTAPPFLAGCDGPVATSL